MTKESKSCFDEALKMLSYRGYFSGELSDKLKMKAFSSEERQECLTRLKEHKLLDDEARARDFIHYYAEKGNGPRWISYQLAQKSALTKAEIETLIDEDFPVERQLEVMQRLAAKKFSNIESDYKGQQKIAAYFYRKGFEQNSLSLFLEYFNSDQGFIC